MTNKTLEEYYNRTSKRFWNPTGGLQGRDHLVDELTVNCEGSFLEYGCGAGSLLVELSRRAQFTQCYGIDISLNALQKIETAWSALELSKQLNLNQPVNDLLPFIENEKIDLLVSVATIEHVIDPYKVLDELHRIASPGATLICSVPNYAYIKHRVALLMGRLPKTGTDEPVKNWREAGWDGMHLHTFTKEAFSTLLIDCGWRPVEWTGWGEKYKFISKYRKKYPGLLSGEIMARCVKI